MKISETIGEHIKKVRTGVLNISQKQLAENLNITPVYMSYLEKGKKIPSVELLENIYKLIGQNELPPEVTSILAASKTLKKQQGNTIITPNVVYLLEERGLFDLKKLNKLHEANPDNLVYIFGILTLLQRKGKTKEAGQHLLQSLLNLENNEDKKWLQALYHKIQDDLELALILMNRAVEEFNQKNPKPDSKNKIKKAKLMFQLASLYFDSGQKKYNSGNCEAAKENFLKALEIHQEIRNIDKNPYHQMDYSSIFFWLALLGIEPKQNLEKYIQEAKTALALNFYEGVKNFPAKEWISVYSKPFINVTVSFLARAYAEIAKLETDTEKRNNYLNQGEFLLIQNTPIDLKVQSGEYYRFNFNCSNFYSIKAEIKSLLKEDFSLEFDLCEKFLNEAIKSDAKNNSNLLLNELSSQDGLEFYKLVHKDKVNKLLKELKKKGKANV